MRRTLAFTSLTALALATAIAPSALAAPALRVQVDQHGDFLLIGNTLGFECAGGTPAPVVGTISPTACIQTGVADSAPDLFWRSEAPAAGQALADQATTAAQARSTAILTIPAGATVTHAFLYWGAESPSGNADGTVTLDRPGGFSQDVAAIQSFVPGVNNSYQSVADVTSIVQAQGSGAYRVSGIDVVGLVNQNNNNAFGGWSMVVLYQRATDPLRNLAIFDGLDTVSNGNNQSVNLNGFLVPNAGFDGKLGIITYEGDNSITGDQLFFNGGAALSDAMNPATNFFNGTRSNLGAAVSVAGDLPQLTGGPQSMGGMDLDIVDVTSKLSAGQTSAAVQATSTGDVYYLGAFITSISTFKPDFSTSGKTALDVNGGLLLPGDQLRYTINVVNTGNDTSVNTVLTDALPPGVTFVPGSIQITAGANAGAKTDAAGDDQGEYSAATRTVTVRLGAGANGTQGGNIAINGSTTVTFLVTVDAGFSGNLANQATISAAGLLGAPTTQTPTDGNGPASGSPPTTVTVDQCATNTDCMMPTPVCDTGVSPHVCVGCLADSDCGGPTSATVCNAATKTCEPGCRGTGGNGCDPASMNNVCTSTDATIGQCVDCLKDSDCGGPMSGTVCNAANDTCQPGCRGVGGNGCAAGVVCTSMDTTIGQCVGCLQDSDCGGPTSGQVCDLTMGPSFETCIPGCRSTGGNGCNPNDPAHDVCTSTDATVGQCVDCTADVNCGGPTSGKVCDLTMGASFETCIDGCRGTGGNGCNPNDATHDVCTSTDNTVGQCVDCLADADCGGPTSAKVCDPSNNCVSGCHPIQSSGQPGNSCDPQAAGMDLCTSTDATIGQCVDCLADSDCGGTESGKVCDTSGHTCIDGCRGTGNHCLPGLTCTSMDDTIGQCVMGSSTGSSMTTGSGGGGNGGAGGSSSQQVFAEGNGILCTASPAGSRSGGAEWLVAAIALGLAGRRKRAAR
jgi:uncharacterized repeat protein (TIGR01451 family)